MDQVSKRRWAFSLIHLLMALAILYVIQSSLAPPRPKEVSYTEFVAAARAGQLAEVRIAEQELAGTLKEEAAKAQGGARQITATRLPGVEITDLLKDLEAQQVKVSGRIETPSWWKELLVGWMLPLLFILFIYGLGMWRLSKSGAGPLTFGKTRAKVYDQSTQARLTFNDVAGVDEAEAELVEVVDFLKNPQKYQQLGGRIPKGVLLPLRSGS